MSEELRTAGTGKLLREIVPRRGPFRRMSDVWTYRELLVKLTRKELRVKYMNSALGLVWSLLNPILYLVVFWIVFQLIFKTVVPNYALFLMSGLVIWNLFNATLTTATTAIVANSPLVNKVYFPKEVLPLATVGAGLVHFVLQLGVLAAALAAFRHSPSPSFSLLLPLAFLVLVALLVALVLLCSALNVYFRDMQHLLELLLLVWFWVTPVVYQYRLVSDRIGNVFLLNPITPIVITFQRALYNRAVVTNAGTTKALLPTEDTWWYLRNLAVVGVLAGALLLVAFWVFGRLEEGFAEEL